MKKGILRSGVICFTCFLLFLALPAGVAVESSADDYYSEATLISSPGTELPEAVDLPPYWGLLIWFAATGGLLLVVRITELYPRKK